MQSREAKGIDRRQFLQAMSALAAGVAIPEIGAASEEAVNAAWEAANEEPLMFYVDYCGALTTEPAFKEPSSRCELLGLEHVTTREDLIVLAEGDRGVSSFLDYEAENAGVEDASWKVWIDRLDDVALAEVLAATNAYLDDSPDDEDYERADLSGVSGRGSALHFFRDAFEESELLDIQIVEGDRPGSSYFAAELRMDIDEANAIATREGIPIRFAEQA